MNRFIKRLNHSEEGHEINDEKFTLTSNNKVHILKHHNIKEGSIVVYTQEDKSGTNITDFTIGKHHEKDWQTVLTFGGGVIARDYYVSYVSHGDDNDADDINNIYDEISGSMRYLGVADNIDELLETGFYTISHNTLGTLPSLGSDSILETGMVLFIINFQESKSSAQHITQSQTAFIYDYLLGNSEIFIRYWNFKKDGTIEEYNKSDWSSIGGGGGGGGRISSFDEFLDAIYNNDEPPLGTFYYNQNNASEIANAFGALPSEYFNPSYGLITIAFDEYFGYPLATITPLDQPELGMFAFDFQSSSWKSLGSGGGGGGHKQIVYLSGGNPTVHLAEGDTFISIINEETTYSFIGKGETDYQSFKLLISIEEVAHPIIFPNNIYWHENNIPELSMINTYYAISFESVDGGNTWLGRVYHTNTSNVPIGYTLAKDSDFSGSENGEFIYTGDSKRVVIPHVIKGIPVTSYRGMFEFTNVEGVYSNNSNVTDMARMFYSSTATTLDLSSFDTNNVTDMSSMFYGSKATTLDLSSFDTNNVTDMYSMFYGSAATTLDLSSFDTSSVTNMARMFYSSTATTLDLSSFDTNNVTDMSSMFNSSKATTLDLSSFDTSSVTDMARMFSFSQATTLDLSSFDTSSVTNMSYMFYESQATTLDLSSFDTSSVTDMSYMFYESQATIGYARTQADADRFNASSDKPSALNFVVK